MNEAPNILLVILDALRQDTGDPGTDHPDRYVGARTCVASAPWTLPSCTSLLTGMSAHRHGRFWQGLPIVANPLVDAVPSSYRKVGIVNNGAISKGSGAETGFDKWIFTRDHDESFQRAGRLISRAGRRRRHPMFIVLHSNIVHDYCLPIAKRYAPAVGPPVLGDRVISWRDTDGPDRVAAVETYRACATAQAARVDEVLDAVRQRDDFVTAVTSDHGEGFDFEWGRLHHGGRVHQDLLHVPLHFDLPSSIRADRRDELVGVLDSQAVGGIDVVPTLLDLAGHPVPPVDGVPVGRIGPRTVVSEDRRYFYLNDRFRLNYRGFHKHMSEADLERNQTLLDQLAEGPVVRSFLHYPRKLIVTGVRLRPGTPAGEAGPRLRHFHELLLGAPVAAFHSDRLFAFELFDLIDDPTEQHNLLADQPGWRRELTAMAWSGDITMPAGGGVETDLVTMVSEDG